MTTGWGAGERRPGDRWEAPRLAYELSAAWAEAAASGGGGGLTLPPAALKTWDDLTLLEQHDVADALRSQARAALYLLGRRRPELVASARESTSLQVLCSHARIAATAMSSLEPVPWALPACSGCAAICAAVLCEIQYRAYHLMGFDPEKMAAEFAALAAGAPASVMFIPVPRDRS